MVSRSAAMSLEERVREQGEKVRRLKADKAPKEEVSCENISFNMGSIVNDGSGGIQQLSILHIFCGGLLAAGVHFCYCNIIGPDSDIYGRLLSCHCIDCFSGLTNLPNLPWNTGPAGPPLP